MSASQQTASEVTFDDLLSDEEALRAKYLPAAKKDPVLLAALDGIDAVTGRALLAKQGAYGDRRLVALGQGATVGLSLAADPVRVGERFPFPNPERDRQLACVVADLERVVDFYIDAPEPPSPQVDTLLTTVTEMTGLAWSWAEAPKGAQLSNDSDEDSVTLRLETAAKAPPKLTAPHRGMAMAASEAFEELSEAQARVGQICTALALGADHEDSHQWASELVVTLAADLGALGKALGKLACYLTGTPGSCCPATHVRHLERLISAASNEHRVSRESVDAVVIRSAQRAFTANDT